VRIGTLGLHTSTAEHRSATMLSRKKISHARIPLLAQGVIYGLWLAGQSYREINGQVMKNDGNHPSFQAVAACVVRMKRMEKKHGGLIDHGIVVPPDRGRPRTTYTSLDKQITKVVFKFRGKVKGSCLFWVRSIRCWRGGGVLNTGREGEAGKRFCERSGVGGVGVTAFPTTNGANKRNNHKSQPVSLKRSCPLRGN
jgi:hypothetical protein